MKTAQVRDPVHIGKVVRNALVFKFREPRGGTVNDSGPKPAETKTAFDDYTKGITSGRQKDFEFEAEAMADRFRGECSTLLSRIKDDPDQAERAARDLVLSQTRLIALPLAVVHVDESSLLPSVKSLIEDIYNTTETTAGYPSIIGVPHVLSGFIYMACS